MIKISMGGAVLYLVVKSDSERHICTEFKKSVVDVNLLIKNMLIVGDFNFSFVDRLNLKITIGKKCSLKFLEFCFSSSSEQLFSESTRSGNLALVNNKQLVAEPSVMPPTSDSASQT